MSNTTYDIMWREAVMELLDQLEAENPDDSVLAPKDLAEWTCIYVKYIQIYRKLEIAYDQMLHPQKRTDIKAALQACMGRMLEVRHDLVELNSGMDFVRLDDILVDLKLSPEVMEIPIPRYFQEDRAKELQDRDAYLDALLEKFETEKERRPPTEDLLEKAREELKRIQTEELEPAIEDGPERRNLESGTSASEAAASGDGGMDAEKAAILIQSAVRGMQWRKRIKEEQEKELIFIGMKPREVDPESDPSCIEGKNLSRRKALQKEHQRGYETALADLKERVQKMEGQDMREAIHDKINAWFVENRDPETGEYPNFPQDGGSITIINPPATDATPTGEEAQVPSADADTAKGHPSSAFASDLEKVIDGYMSKWQERNEEHNFQQSYDVELVKEELRPIVFEEIRQQVDAEVSVMIQNLKEMLEAERNAKSKKSKKGGKGKKGKSEKKDKKKDPTADRSVESLYSELVSEGIVQKCPRVKMEDYAGTFSFLGSNFERAGSLQEASMAQIRQILTEVPHLKTVLLYGFECTGKSMLSQAVAHGAGANFFNLSPRNTDGKYTGKQVPLLLHMVFKVAKIMAPSVVYIDECEKVFVTDKKRVKEFGGSEPFSRIKKDLLKEVKALVPGDRVLVIGNSREPQMCVKKDEKAFVAFWDKHFALPLPDYASRRVLWAVFFSRHGYRLPYDFDLSTLSHLSEGMAAGTMERVVQTVLSAEEADRKGVSLEQIQACMSLFHTVTQTEREETKSWTQKGFEATSAPEKGGRGGADAKKPKTEKKK